MTTKWVLRSYRITAALLATMFAATQIGCSTTATVRTYGPADQNAPQQQQDDQADQGDDSQDQDAEPQAGQEPNTDDDVSVQDFEEPLAVHGTWVDDPDYGRVWQPDSDTVGEDFEPYATGGEWVASDDGESWAFQSQWDDDFGWATYHYGRWVDHDDYGWVWIPGTDWAPSWVEWRYGGGYVGWAPMGPAGVEIPEDRWVFVEERYMTSPRVVTYRLPPDRVSVAWSVAVPMTTTRMYGRSRVFAGPPVARIRSVATVRTARVSKPPRGHAKSHGKMTLAKAMKAGKKAHKAAAPKIKKAAKAGKPKKSAYKKPPPKPKKSPSASKSKPRSSPKPASKPRSSGGSKKGKKR